MATRKKVFVANSFQNTISFDNWGKSNNNIFNLNTNNVGVNNINPEVLFDASGQAIISSLLVKLGVDAGSSNQGSGAIAIGFQAGMCNQDVSCVAIGFQAGMINQRGASVAIGYQAGMCNQDISSVAVGTEAGKFNQSSGAVAVGFQAGMCNQGVCAVAIGDQAGMTNQGINAVAIGTQAGMCNQGANACALGYQAGMNNQGSNSICIGAFSSSTFQNSIVINATGDISNPLVADTSNALFIKPIDISTGINNVLIYNAVSGKVSYSTSKTFIIDHPQEKDKYLVHACIEGPEAGVYYRGIGKIINNENTEIELPGYCKSFNSFTVELTPINKYISLYSTDVIDNKIKVFGPNGEFYFHVFGTRQSIDISPDKKTTCVIGESPYKFIC